MAYLGAAVAVVGMLCILDLLLTYGVIRRLRIHTEQLTAGYGGSGNPRSLPGRGSRIGDFAANTVDGRPVEPGMFARETVVGFFSPTCGPCKDMLPLFVEHAAEVLDGRSRVLAVVVSDPQEAASLVSVLEPVAQVVVEQRDGAMSGAFSVTGFPSLFVVNEDRTIVASGHTMAAVREPAAAGSGR